MKYGYMVHPGHDIVAGIRGIRRAGFDFAEITFEPPLATTTRLSALVKKLGAEQKKFHAPYVGHTAWWIDFWSEYDAVRAAWIEEFGRMIDLAAALGMRALSVHCSSSGLYDTATQANGIVNFIASLKEVAQYGKERNVIIMLENVPSEKPWGSFPVYKKIVRGAKVNVHFDIAHAFIVGGMPEIKKYARTFGKDIIHLHVHDNHGQWDEHLPLGAGAIDWATVIQELKRARFAKTTTFEVFTSLADGMASRKAFQRLWLK